MLYAQRDWINNGFMNRQEIHVSELLNWKLYGRATDEWRKKK